MKRNILLFLGLVFIFLTLSSLTLPPVLASSDTCSDACGKAGYKESYCRWKTPPLFLPGSGCAVYGETLMLAITNCGITTDCCCKTLASTPRDSSGPATDCNGRIAYNDDPKRYMQWESKCQDKIQAPFSGGIGQGCLEQACGAWQQCDEYAVGDQGGCLSDQICNSQGQCETKKPPPSQCSAGAQPCPDTTKNPPPHYCLKNGQCLPSCGHAGTINGVSVQCSSSPCSGQNLESYDCPYCCVTGTSSTNPCQTAGQCSPDAGCRRGATLGFCLSLSEYQSYSSLNNFFEPLSGTYSCGPNNCLVACHNDECCQIIRGNCYASVGTLARMGVVGATLANLPTGCGTFGPTTDTNLLLNCDDAGGNSCAGTQPPGATLVDQDPHYGPQHCYNLQNQCTAPQTNCNGQCVNTNTDNNNCGICGNECDIGLTCTNGQCQPSGGGGGTSTVTTTVTSTSTVTTTTTTTTTTTPPTTTTTTTTTTTQPPIFAISCGACEAGLTCSCSLSGTCNKGNWVLSNSQGTPLSQTLRSAIPPLTFTYVANDSGTILAEATCADPANYNFTTVTVTPKFLTCQDSCNTGVDCICQIRDCTSGVAYVSNSVGTPIPTLLSFQFNGNYALKFQATQGGEVEVRAICDNPVKSVKSTIKINGTTTTTTPPTTGIFTVSNFACSPLSGTTGAYKCSASYNNGLNENVVLIMLVSLKSSGAVKTYTPFTLPQIQDQISTNYYCSILGTGTYYVSWQAYRQSDSLQVNPIAWSTGAETQTIVCS